MSKLRELKQRILAEGEDLCISDADVALIRECLPADGSATAADLAVLAEMRSDARVVSPAFDQLFFPAFKAHLLADGTISLPEQFQLLRLLYGGGGIDAAKRRFLQQLRAEVREVTPEFEALCRQAMAE
jgi:hypothetical protein